MESDPSIAGKIQPTSPPPLPPMAAPTPIATPLPTPHKHWTWYVAAAILLVVVLGGIGTYYYFAHRAYSNEQILALIRTDILPSVVQIGCAGEDGGPEVQIGSGLYYIANGTPTVATNAHVVLGSDGQYHGCNVYFPRPSDGSFYDSSYITGAPLLYNTAEASISGKITEGLDFATLPLTGANTDAQGVSFPFPPKQKDAAEEIQKICRPRSATINIGDSLYLLGYPGTGGDSITLTEGVVSGFSGDFDQLIKVSATTNFGNSGGLAIGASDGCEYGIPAEATFSPGGNLGLVLSSSFITTYLGGLTGGSAYTPPTTKDSTTYLTQDYSLPDFSIKYPAQWTATRSATDQTGSWSVTFMSPSEGALDDFSELSTIYVTPNVPPEKYQADIEADQKVVLSIDQEAKGKNVTLGEDVHTYQFVFTDSTEQSYAIPVRKYSILFLIGSTEYEIDSVMAAGVNDYTYLLMFANMGDSMVFTH